MFTGFFSVMWITAETEFIFCPLLLISVDEFVINDIMMILVCCNLSIVFSPPFFVVAGSVYVILRCWCSYKLDSYMVERDIFLIWLLLAILLLSGVAMGICLWKWQWPWLLYVLLIHVVIYKSGAITPDGMIMILIYIYISYTSI